MDARHQHDDQQRPEVEGHTRSPFDSDDDDDERWESLGLNPTSSIEPSGPSNEYTTSSNEQSGPSNEYPTTSVERSGPSNEYVLVCSKEHGNMFDLMRAISILRI